MYIHFQASCTYFLYDWGSNTFLSGVRDLLLQDMLCLVSGGWGLDALGKLFRRRRRRRCLRRRPPGVWGGRRDFGFSRNQITEMRPQAHFCDLIS